MEPIWYWKRPEGTSKHSSLRSVVVTNSWFEFGESITLLRPPLGLLTLLIGASVSASKRSTELGSAPEVARYFASLLMDVAMGFLGREAARYLTGM